MSGVKAETLKQSLNLENHRAPAAAGGSFKRNSSDATMEDYEFDSSPPLIAKKHKQSKDTMASDHGISTTEVGPVDGAKQLNSSKSGKSHSFDYNASNSDAYDTDDYSDEDDDASEYDDGEVEFLSDDDNYLEMQAQFDNVDLPPGVEASVPWPVDSGSTEGSKAGVDNANVASSSRASELNSKHKHEEPQMDDVLRKLMYFKRFDTVEDYSDHHYKRQGLGDVQPLKQWAKSIQDEWRMLEENLPETIFVRAYESRMDLMRAAIIGPDGTPYHDGVFFFDILFPSNYPYRPPSVHYHSGGLRLNPNLYKCGKVCLSLLGTWTGESNEMWIPNKSTMLQVLVSIQALILNAKPFFNEPGYENLYKGAVGEKKSKKYSEEMFILSLKTMMYSLKNPPMHFGDLVAGHFRIRAPDILTACKVYSEGAEVGSDIRKMIKEGEKIENNNSKEFKLSLSKVVGNLRESFTGNGSKDCVEFQI
ncbi:hypothetical protein V2J09_006453 [Rumex salicifolius]